MARNHQRPYLLHSIPEPNSGTKILSAKEITRLLKRTPNYRQALNNINRLEGKPREIERIWHESGRKVMDVVMANKRQIDLQVEKQKMLNSV